ncbi:hypothetical protein ATANTOWER_028141 [Ataeniobius toweri]|uniref:Uncharacterized protein n=1 Tax=Ataeniobius toweri TaxID=208326 RepID=A0ABU7ACJ5_9TELE|nr:hypothetical protein [Ataeniobius toweri]
MVIQLRKHVCAMAVFHVPPVGTSTTLKKSANYALNKCLLLVCMSIEWSFVISCLLYRTGGQPYVLCAGHQCISSHLTIQMISCILIGWRAVEEGVGAGLHLYKNQD